MNHTLFELSARFQEILHSVNDIEEINEETLAQLESAGVSLEEKILNWTSVIKSMEAKSDSIRKAAEGMIKRAENLEKNAERMKEILLEEMKRCDKKKVENEHHSVSLVQSPPRVEYTDKSILPEEYWRVKLVTEPETSGISKLLKEGVMIPGCQLVRGYRLAIR